MTLTEITEEAINPALLLLPMAMDTLEARALLLAIGLQESGFKVRRQFGDGPARGFWQFEAGGGAKGVCKHAKSTVLMEAVCKTRNCAFTPEMLWRRIEFDDVLAAAAARLLIFTDPFRLPALTDVDGAWRLYNDRCWRPGKPHPEKWPGNHLQAVRFVMKQE